jgi:hypothetical protein
LFCTVGVALVLSMAGCSGIGNTSGTCASGDTCECDILGNCQYNCPGGSCHFRCKGTGNCIFECEGGGCDLVCENTGNCIMDCPGDDCSITCMGSGNCILNKCTAGCDPDGGVDAGVDGSPPPDHGVDPDHGLPPDSFVQPDSWVGDGPIPWDGCVPQTCAEQGKNCGQHNNGCGGTISCGTCSAGTCGGGGTPGVCGCPSTDVTPPANPATGKNLATAGMVSWSLPTQIVSANAGSGTIPSGVAYAQLSASNTPTRYLVASGFGLNVPAGAIINGIEVDVRRRARTSSSNIKDNQVRLVLGAVLPQANRAKTTTWSTNWIYSSYGGQSDLWGRVWTSAQINDPNFGVAIAVAWNGTSSGSEYAFVDHVRVMIHYSTSCGCVPATCSSLGYNCGSHSDGCGGTVICGTCSTGTCVNGQCCVPGTCSGLGYNCGTHSDGCGGTVNCGTCSSGTCYNGQCCTASTCSGLGYTCGTHSDGCGGTINCGICSSGSCVNGQCCAPDTCASLGYNCGSYSDGCGGTLDCGTCATGDTCTLGVCGCTNGVKNGTETDVDCGGVCLTKCAQGAICITNNDCSTGSCADGVCCNTACLGACQACVNAKTGAATGTCANITAGTDPDNECAATAASTCGTTGFCSAGACALHPVGTQCAPASCTAGVETLADTCDGAGNCVDNGTSNCVSPYVCAATTCESCTDTVMNGNETDVDCGGGGACPACGVGKTCTLTSDCGSGLFCTDGVCCTTECLDSDPAAFCMRCDLPGTVGTCSFIEMSDPDLECTAGNKVCSGGACVKP